jgi:chromosome segregation ATPase
LSTASNTAATAATVPHTLQCRRKQEENVQLTQAQAQSQQDRADLQAAQQLLQQTQAELNATKHAVDEKQQAADDLTARVADLDRELHR